MVNGSLQQLSPLYTFKNWIAFKWILQFLVTRRPPDQNNILFPLFLPTVRYQAQIVFLLTSSETVDPIPQLFLSLPHSAQMLSAQGRPWVTQTAAAMLWGVAAGWESNSGQLSQARAGRCQACCRSHQGAKYGSKMQDSLVIFLMWLLSYVKNVVSDAHSRTLSWSSR